MRMKKEIVSSPAAPAAVGPYSQGVRATGFIFVSGQIHLALSGEIVPGGIEAQTAQALKNLGAVLSAAGLTLEDEEYYAGGSALLKGREMTEAILKRSPQLDFLYYSNDMIGAGGLLYCLDKGIDVPGRVGLAGFNGIELLDGLPRRLATMDACRREIGRHAAEIICGKHEGGSIGGEVIELMPTLQPGDTIRRSV